MNSHNNDYCTIITSITDIYNRFQFVRYNRHRQRLRQNVQLALSLFFGAIFAIPSPTVAQEFDPRSYRDDLAGQPTQVMVLGTAHLNAAPEDWDPEVLETLLSRLEQFHPDVIATEDQSGPSLVKLWAYRETSPRTASKYGGFAMRMAAEAGLGLDLDIPQAEVELRRLLTQLPKEPTTKDRRQLAAHFAAAGYPHSALIQWWRIPSGERVVGDGISPRLATMLEDLGRSKNESVTIAVRLATRLGLERLDPMDAQDEDVFTLHESDLFARLLFPAIGQRYSADPLLKDSGDVALMTDAQATLAEYRKLNDESRNLRSSEIEWLGAIDKATEENVGRKRVAGWEVRNMRMASNIREASARAPGGRVLVVVGAAHKIWLEAYLNMMTDIKVVSTDTVLN